MEVRTAPWFVRAALVSLLALSLLLTACGGDSRKSGEFYVNPRGAPAGSAPAAGF